MSPMNYNDFPVVYRHDFDKISIRQVVGDLTGRTMCETVRGMNPCPLCGHRDCFKFIPDVQKFKCFSTDCMKSGGVLKFVEYYCKLSSKQAAKYLINTYFSTPLLYEEAKHVF